MARGWIGVDFDGTLVKKMQWHGLHDGCIGEPIEPMVERVKRWLEEGKNVRIVTARVANGFDPHNESYKRIREWCLYHIGQPLPITAEKDPRMIELWDDRVVQVEPDTGEPVDPSRTYD